MGVVSEGDRDNMEHISLFEPMKCGAEGFRLYLNPDHQISVLVSKHVLVINQIASEIKFVSVKYCIIYYVY